jgi:general stress protein 26
MSAEGHVSGKQPIAELDPDFSSEGATAIAWEQARRQLEGAKVYWLSTVRPDGRPHVTPIAAVWLDGALHFTTGKTERKARNLAQNSYCVVTTGTDLLDGLDVVVEGTAVRVTDVARLQRLADAYVPKYGDLFRFTIGDGALRGEGSEDDALAFEVRATKAFGFGKGRTFSQTSYRF